MTKVVFPPKIDGELLMPPKPHEVYGWGRFKRIVCCFPLEPIEIAGALALISAGAWFIWPGHEFPTGGVLSYIYGNNNIPVWGIAFLIIGLYKLWAILWGYEKIHRLIATVLVSLVAWLVFLAYQEVYPDNVMNLVLIVGMIMQFWIALRNRSGWQFLCHLWTKICKPWVR